MDMLDFDLQDLCDEASAEARRKRNARFRRELEMKKAVEKENRWLIYAACLALSTWIIAGLRLIHWA